MVQMIVKVDVKIDGNDEFMRCGSGKRKERIKFTKKNSRTVDIGCIYRRCKLPPALRTRRIN